MSATVLNPNSVQLYGSVNPNGESAVGYFRFSATDPGTCNDTFGTRFPSTGGTGVGSGSADQPFNIVVNTGLLAGTTYYYCTIGSNASGKGYGNVLTFTTSVGAPVISTSTATNVQSSTARLEGLANAVGASTTAFFRYSTSNPGSCTNTFGTRVPAVSGGTTVTGNTDTPFFEDISGLQAGVTYYYCAIGTNTQGTRFGSVLSFTTLVAAPTVTTSPATSINGTSATLQGIAVPNGATTTAWFRYASSNPGGCNDVFGTRVPVTNGTGQTINIGSSGSYAYTASPLTPGTTYFYCAIASNSVGTSYGTVQTFTTPNVPTMLTNAQTNLTATSATLNGAANPNGSNTSAWFRYSTTSPGVCDDSFGTYTSSASPGSGNTSVPYSMNITGLLPGTTYYYCAIGYNGVGYGFGPLSSFTTPATAPIMNTSSATTLTGSSATLNGTVNPRGAATTVWFRYGTVDPGTTCLDTYGTRLPATGGQVFPASNTTSSYGEALAGLTPGTTYYYCAFGSNSMGQTIATRSSFTTPDVPTVTTGLPTVYSDGIDAYMYGTVTSNGAISTGWFQYGTTNPGASCGDTYGTRYPATGGTTFSAGAVGNSLSQYISTLTPGTTYYYCAFASNIVGIGRGAPQSFTTPNYPMVTTLAATSVTSPPTTSSSAILNATIDPRGAATTYYFRYGTTDPGVACTDSYGSSTSAASISATASSANYTRSVSLLPGVTYWFCAVAYNDVNNQTRYFGAPMSFTTPATAPYPVNTVTISALTGNSVTFQGSANPRGAVTTAFFRYATTDPGTCNDTFGTRVPAGSGNGTQLNATTGLNTTTTFTEPVTGLTPGTTYYFCAIATNSLGTNFGGMYSFTTPNIPTVTTNLPTVYNNGTTANFYGTFVANGATSYAYFRYATTDPGTCNDTFGTRYPTNSGNDYGFSSSTTVGTDSMTPYQVSGLTPGTTYYFCALGRNLVGVGVGAVRSFTTPNIPTVVTTAINASQITATSALLEGTATPNGANATAYFRWATTNPGTCTDNTSTWPSTRSPSSGGTLITSASQAFSVTPANLLPGTTYYYCALATNTVGIGVGAVNTFTTPPTAPIVNTSTPTLVTSTSATLRGAVDPRGAATTAWFRYSTTSPGTSCNDTFGTRAPSSGGTSVPAGNGYVNFSEPISGLQLATTYYYCAIAQNTQGISFGTVGSFTTLPEPPFITTIAANPITTTSAQLNASANPNGALTTGWIRYSQTDPGTCNDTFGTRLPSNGGTSIAAGTTTIPYSYTPTNLTPGTTYYFCALGTNSASSTPSVGQVLTFKTTSTPPSVTTLAATSVTGTTATIGSSINPNGDTTTAWFRFGTTDPGASCNDTFGTKIPAAGSNLGNGAAAVSFPQNLTGLTPGTTYYFCAIAQNSLGTTLGTRLSFATPNAPAVFTQPASPVTSTSATLNGKAAGNGNASLAWFRYSQTDPGVCNDTFGTRAPAGTGGSSISTSSTLQDFQQSISGLSPGVTYYFCAIADNPVGKSLGDVFSLTTPAAIPSVTVAAATNIGATTARFNASANPNGDTATGYFRYATTSPGTCNTAFGARFPASGGSALGTGTTSVNYSQDVTGLLNGTTYYYCAFADNGVGTGVGAGVQSFRTTAAPVVSSSAVTALATTTVTLNGTVDAEGDTATAWFRYDTTSPGTNCNDTFGTRAPVGTGGTTITGSTSTSFSENLTGLSQGTTYYYCAIAQNSVGKSFGSVRTFTTLTAPTVTTAAATNIGSTSVTLNGSANPNGQTSTAYFRYSTTNPTTCSDTFGTRYPSSGGTSIPSTSGNTPYTYSPTGLSPGTTYYFCAIASNASGLGFGSVMSFTTLAVPTITTNAATLVTTTTATLNGSSDPRGADATAYFRYGTTNPGTTCTSLYGTSTTGQTIAVGSGDKPFSQALTGLTAGATYYYCAYSSNSVGLSIGQTQVFTMQSPPAVTTLAVSGVTNTTATLNGQANPKSSATTGWFRYSTTNPTTCNDTFGTRIPTTPASDTALGSGGVPVAYNQPLTGLTASTTYYYCAIAENTLGKSYGTVLTFATSTPATVTTIANDYIGPTDADLNGSAIPRGTATTGWFRYSTVDPGTCNDTFGTRAPATGGTALGSSATVATSYVEYVTGLTQATTYYYCAIAQNAAGLSFGAVMSFSTQKPPTVTTAAATSVTTTLATMNGTSNQNGLSGYYWFRYFTTDPGTCTDVGGTRVPTTNGTGNTLTSSSTVQNFTRSTLTLTSGATYYYCAFASNSLGTSAGTVQSFTTLQTPLVVTNPATAVAATSVQLEGSGTPRGTQTTGYFRYGTTYPGTTCTTTYGTRWPAVGGDDLGSGTAAVAFNEPLTGLQPATLYYYCAFATSAAGTVIGSNQSFTTLNAPAVTTVGSSNVTGTTATLSGTANPRGDATTGWFRYSTTNPTTCNDTFGTRAPVGTGGTALGTGTSAAPFTENLTGLSPGTTYYYCAIAQNSVGTAFGSVLTFSTPGAPVVVTNAATNVTGSTATLNGAGTPNGAATDGYFRYSATDPGSCTASFGTRLPSSGGTALGTGFTSVVFTQSVAGLSPGTTYYYCAYATNVVGSANGTVQSFSTPSAPVVTTVAASSVTSTSATLNGSATTGGAATTGWFRYSTSSPTSCNDTFGTRAPLSGGDSLGSGTGSQSYNEFLTGLVPGATYYYCAIASNSVGLAYGQVLSFTAPAQQPLVVTNAASNVTSTAAILNGSGTPRGAATTGYFRYSITNPFSCNDTFGTRAPLTGGTNLGSGQTAVTFTQGLSGLVPGTTYYFCAITSSSAGTALGSVLTFRTAAAPIVVTSSASAVTSSSATLNGAATPNGAATTGWFRFSTTSPNTCDDSFGTRVPSVGGVSLNNGLTSVGYSQNVNGLLPGRTYFFCAIAANNYGTVVGQLLSFTVDAPPPTVSTLAGSDITSSSATLNGTANPNQNESIGWFRYDTIDPVTCNDTFGARAPATEGIALGAGSAAAPYAASLDGLKPNTTYYVCAVASNIGGAGFGTVVQVKTAPAKPVVKTVGSSVEPSGIVTLKGTANPNGLDATAWFQYGTTNPGQCHSGFGQRTRLYQIGNGQTDAQFTEALSNLTAGTYYFCAVAFTSAGESVGEVLSFEVGGGGANAGGCGCSSGSGAMVLLALAGAVMLRRSRKRA